MFEIFICVLGSLLIALTFLLIGFVMGRKTYVAPVIKVKEEKVKEAQPFVENIEEDPYAQALKEDSPAPKVVSSM